MCVINLKSNMIMSENAGKQSLKVRTLETSGIYCYIKIISNTKLNSFSFKRERERIDPHLLENELVKSPCFVKRFESYVRIILVQKQCFMEVHLIARFTSQPIRKNTFIAACELSLARVFILLFYLMKIYLCDSSKAFSVVKSLELTLLDKSVVSAFSSLSMFSEELIAVLRIL